MSIAYSAIKAFIFFAPAQPPLSGEPKSAAPLPNITTCCGPSSARSAARTQKKVSFVSTSHGLEKLSHECSCSGRRSNGVPALKTSKFGLVSDRIRLVACSSVASATMILAEVFRARSSSFSRRRATAVTVIPLATRLSTTPRPKPRLAPTTSAVCPLKFIFPPRRSVLLVQKAKNIAIGAEIIEKSLLVSHDLGLFCLSDELDHVAFLSDPLFKNERLKKTRTWNCSNVFVRDVRSVEHQVWHGHGMNIPVRKHPCAHDRRDHIRYACFFWNFIGLVLVALLNFSFQSNRTHSLNAKCGRVHNNF